MLGFPVKLGKRSVVERISGKIFFKHELAVFDDQYGVDHMFNVIENHAKDGVDFMTLHCGVTKSITDYLKRYPRLMGMVSRGGTFLAAWILHNETETPLFSNYDYLLELAKEYDFSISLGDGLRPGCIFDASDWSQMTELLTISELVKRAQAANVQVFVEVGLSQI